VYTDLLGKGFNVMFKKLLIAAVAVIAGTMVLSKVTKISPRVWFGDCCRSIRNAVPPEVQLRQLNDEIANIDNDIKKNIGRVAAMEVDVKSIENRVASQRAHLADLKADMVAMKKSLEDGSWKVSKIDGSELTRKLDRTINEYTSLKENNKIQEKVLQEKKRALETAHNRLTKMVNEKANLTLLSSRLAGHLETVRMKQTGTPVEFDDSAIARCRELANEIETRLNKAEIEAKLLSHYGFEKSASKLDDDGKSQDEVLKAAKKALQEENADDEVSIDRNEK